MKLRILCLVWLLLAAGVFAQVVKVKRVVDGDTFIAEETKTEYPVRLLFVDTPESVHPDIKQNHPMGKVASNWTKKRIENTYVTLQTPVDSDEEDRFHRKLAIVFHGESCINLELIQHGLSPYYTKFGKAPEPWHSKFANAEKQARDTKQGIWSDPELTKKYLRMKSKWGTKNPKKKKDR
ncbi:MAG: thermonuclease family protein [bacterium]|nr:thermonuclease family protein [bacterium]